jgi:sialate O-acetylesterase
MKIAKALLILALIVLPISFCNAKIICCALISDNMVLQRNATVKFWGSGNAGDKITVFTEWNNAKTATVCGNDGKWNVSLQTTDAGGPYTVAVSSKSEIITFRNILLGEVWLCSGQSNMGMIMKGYPDQPINGSNDFLADADNDNIRFFIEKSNPSPVLVDTCNGKWQIASSTSVANFSALAYLFAKQLQQKLKVPVGMVYTAFGGTRIEAWMSAEANAANQSKELDENNKPFNLQNRTAHLYNGNIYPLINYVIKGAIWYQGESNVRNYPGYANQMASMVKNWRKDFGVGDFPFYYVEIAPYSNGYNVNSALLRAEQVKALNLIPNSGMVSTIDVGEETKIHPAEKATVAKRLSYYALSEVYGHTGIACKTPTYRTMSVQNDSVVCLYFDNIKYGLSTFGKTVDCMEIAGSDKIFYPADISIKDKKVMVNSPKVKKPVAVRYGYSSFPKTRGYLYNTEGLPVPSFRTDEWDK